MSSIEVAEDVVERAVYVRKVFPISIWGSSLIGVGIEVPGANYRHIIEGKSALYHTATVRDVTKHLDVIRDLRDDCVKVVGAGETERLLNLFLQHFNGGWRSVK